MENVPTFSPEALAQIREQVLRRTIAAFVCIGVTLACVAMLGVWGVWRDLSQARATVLRLEMNRLRSLGERTAGSIESQLAAEDARDLARTKTADWVREHWREVMPKEPNRLYGAVVDSSDAVAIHTHREFEGRRLEADWRDRTLDEVGDDIVETRSQALAGGRRAFDVELPIEIQGRTAAFYHLGLDADKFERAHSEAFRRIMRRWGVVIGGIVAVATLASLSLLHIARRTAQMHQQLERNRLQRAAELSQLMIALAHEIRNPLNAIRLNLHMLEREQRGERLAAEDRPRMLHESLEEVDRVDVLLKEMLDFVPRRHASQEFIDLGAEVRSAARFMQQVLLAEQIDLRVRLPEKEILARFDHSRFRQVLLNLLNNARDAAGRGGWIQVDVVRLPDGAELSVSDSGPGVASSLRERVFEPFFTTKENGVGLGLALVRRFVEEAGGRVTYEHHEARGGRFRIWLPEASLCDEGKAA